MLGLAAAILGVTLAVVLLLGGNSRRFRRRVAAEAAELWGAAASRPVRVDRERWTGLPPPVRRYAALAVGARERVVAAARLRHGGRFRPRLDGGWLAIRGEQYFVADPPGFVWWGRARVAPGLWVEARDRCFDGVGSMRVVLESTLTLSDAAGPALDQGAALRVLAEMVWLPTSLLDPRYVSWSALDGDRARATLRLGACVVSGEFRFGADGLPVAFAAERERDLGRGRSALTPWSGEYADYRDVAGLQVPQRVKVCWHVDGEARPYAYFTVERLEYDVREPFPG